MRLYRLTSPDGKRAAETQAFNEMSARSKVAMEDNSVPVGYWSWAATAELIFCDDEVPYTDLTSIRFS